MTLVFWLTLVLLAPPPDVSLGPGWEAAQANATTAPAAVRFAPIPPRIELTPPPAWAPPPQGVTERLQGSERFRAIHLGVALAVESAMLILGLALTLPSDDDPVDDGRLAPPTQLDALTPR